MDCSLPGSSVHGIFEARVLEWGAIAFSVKWPKSSSNLLKHKKGELRGLFYWQIWVIWQESIKRASFHFLRSNPISLVLLLGRDTYFQQPAKVPRKLMAIGRHRLPMISIRWTIAHPSGFPHWVPAKQLSFGSEEHCCQKDSKSKDISSYFLWNTFYPHQLAFRRYKKILPLWQLESRNELILHWWDLGDTWNTKCTKTITFWKQCLLLCSLTWRRG